MIFSYVYGRSHWRLRTRVAFQIAGHLIVLGFDPVDIGENTAARDCPALREKWDYARVEIPMNTRCAFVVSESIGEQR